MGCVLEYKESAIPERKLLPPPDAADYLGISIPKLNKGRCDGTGPAFVRISSRCIRYHIEDLDRWIAERTFKSTAEYTAAGKPS